MSIAEALEEQAAPQLSLASIMTLVVGYLILKTFGMLALISPLGGHNGICFSCKYIKLIHVINIWETVDFEIPKR